MATAIEINSKPKKRKHGTPGLTFAAEARATVHLEDGHLFSETGEDLFHKFAHDPDRKTQFRNNILVWLDYNNYCVDPSLRGQLMRAIRERQLQAQMEAERAAAIEREKQTLAQMEEELERSRKARAPRGPVAPTLDPRRQQELQLTELEEQALSGLFEIDGGDNLEEDEEEGMPDLAGFEEDEEDLAPPADDPTPPARIRNTRKK